jgi:methionyl-tRNA formyltransferase
LNNAPTLGFTVHELAEEFDSGPIVRTFAVRNDFKTSYQTLRDKALELLFKEIRSVISAYLKNEIEIRRQNEAESNIYYCSKIRASDGYLNSFSQSSNLLHNISRLFTGEGYSELFFCFPSKRFKISSIVDTGIHYLGPANRILKIESERFLVKTNDGAVWVYAEELNEFTRMFKQTHTTPRLDSLT